MDAGERELLMGLSTALGLGLLIGAVRERRKAEAPKRIAGLRTHGLTAVASATAWSLGLPAFVVVLAMVAAVIALSYQHSHDHDPGLTGEIALMLTALLGALAMDHPGLAAGLGVVSAILLYAKAPLHRLAREAISEQEVHDGLVLLASALVILPLVPNRDFGPFGAINPATLWTLVVLVMAISALGHVALRLVGQRWGLALAGFFAGYVSSTAAVVGFGQRVRETPGLLRPAVGAAMLANLASLSLFVPVLLAVSPPLLRAAAAELSAAGAVLLLGGIMGVRGGGSPQQAAPTAQTRMFRIWHALLFAAIIAVVLLAAAAMNHWWGSRGALVAAMIAALAEVHAAAASIGQLFASQAFDVGQARWGLVALLASSVLAKAGVAWASGGRRYGLRVSIGLLAMLGAAIVVRWFA